MNVTRIHRCLNKNKIYRSCSPNDAYTKRERVECHRLIDTSFASKWGVTLAANHNERSAFIFPVTQSNQPRVM